MSKPWKFKCSCLCWGCLKEDDYLHCFNGECKPLEKVEEVKPQSQQGIINWKNGSQWTHYYGAMFECGDYEQLLDDINALLHQQRELTIRECIKTLGKISEEFKGSHAAYGLQKAILVLENLQSLINKQ